MTLSAALNTATSSLRTIQSQLTVASNNIANADDVNYTAKTAKQSTVVLAGQASGVKITDIMSKVDDNLVRQIVEATSLNSSAQTLKNYLQSLSDNLGTLSSTGSGDTLATKLSDLEGTLDELGTTPESATLKNQAVTQLQDVVADLASATQQVQIQRGNADTDIGHAVDSVNDALHEIDTLNDQIVRALAGGNPVGDLEDQRNAALQKVANEIDITSYTEADGRMMVYTGSGQLMLGQNVHELNFAETDPINQNTTYPGGLSGVTLNGQDITSSIRSGSIAGLVNVRDNVMPGLQNTLDSLAVNLRDTLNSIANRGSAYPPPNTLTGTKSFAGTDALTASGTLRVAVTDNTGTVVSTQDFNLSSYATVGDLITDLNTLPGMSASLNASGQLTLAATTGTNGVAVSGGTIGTKNFSGYFGLNDLMIGNGASDLQVNSTLTASPSRFPVGQMNTAAILNVGDKAVAAGSSVQAQAMADAMRSADFSAAAGDIVANVATQLTSAKNRASSSETALNTLVDSFSSQYGVNVDEETARISQLQNSYSASAQVLNAVKSMFDDLLNAVR